MKRNKKVCEKCKREISLSNYEKHFNSCTGIIEKSKYTICPYCEREFTRQGINTHIWRMHGEGKNFDPNRGYKTGERIVWNKGLTEETSDIIKKKSDALSLRYKNKELIQSIKGKKQTKETKNKISKSMKEYLDKNPDKVPFKLNHSSKISYPEKYFKLVFFKENIDLKYHLQVNRFELDFYNEEKKRYVEIDGEQHYKKDKLIDKDIVRTNFLQEKEWLGFRVRWKNYQKLSLEERKKIIEEIRVFMSC